MLPCQLLRCSVRRCAEDRQEEPNAVDESCREREHRKKGEEGERDELSLAVQGLLWRLKGSEVGYDGRECRNKDL